jgi:hypothetical protein
MAALTTVATVATAVAGVAIAALPVAAQDDDAPALEFPEGWEIRFDHEGANRDDLYMVAMPPGIHVTTGPATIAWHPDSVATGDFRIESETFLFDPQGRREAFGFFIGGSDLQGQNQRYTYFLLREGGEFLVKTRSGSETAVVQDWTAHPAIVSYATKPEGAGTAKNVIELGVYGEGLYFSVNGERVWSGSRDGLATEGVFGLRVNHGLNLHVTTIMAHPGIPQISIDEMVVTRYCGCEPCGESKSLADRLRGFLDRLRTEQERKIAVKPAEEGHPPGEEGHPGHPPCR